MPFSEKQNKLFRAAAHDPDIAKSAGISMHVARKLAAEGVKGKKKRNRLSEMASK